MDKQPVSRAASYLIQEYGLQAAGMAEENLEWSLAHNDIEEVSFWKNVIAKIGEIEVTTAMPEDIGGTIRVKPTSD